MQWLNISMLLLPTLELSALKRTEAGEVFGLCAKIEDLHAVNKQLMPIIKEL
jgi:hypothetical protein